MKTRLIAFFSILVMAAAGQDSLVVYYYENFPFAYTEGSKLRGIEPDIIDEYVAWMKSKKGVKLLVTYKAFNDFSNFYASVKDGSSKVIGMGSVSRTADREKEIAFSAPYMRNVSVLITAGNVPTARQKTQSEAIQALGKLSAVAVNKSSHYRYLESIKKQFLPALKITTTESQTKVLDAISNDQTLMGYADIVAYWAYLRNHQKYMKIQKAFNEQNEFFSYILPKNATHSATLAEFFESGFGFTSTKTYRQVLEKYLGYEIIEAVEIR